MIFAFFISLCFSQNGDKWEAWAESLAAKAERIAERVGRDAERNATELAIVAENLATDIEGKFDRGDFDVHFNNWPKAIQFSSSCDAGYLGIHSDHISRKKAEKLGFQNRYGSYVSKVLKNSAAEQAGLQPFDYIYGVEEQRTSDNQNLTDILSDYDPGAEVTLYFIRKGQQKTTKVRLGEYDEYEWDFEDDSQAFLGVRPATNERRNDMDGVTVEIINGSAADEMGLEIGDVIMAINGYPVLDWDDVTTAISNIEPGEKAQVIVKRGDSEITKSAPLKSRTDTEEVENDSYGYTNWDWNNDNNNDNWVSTGGAFLGVYIEKISEKKAKVLGFDNPYGSYVSGVLKNTAAEKAGIMPFDYIFGIDEYRVGVEQQLGGILMKYEAGDEATVHLYRNGNKTKKVVVFRAHADAKKESKNKCEDPFLGIIELDKENNQIGIKIKPINESTAMKMGLEEGDIFTHLNGYQMYDWTDVGIAINMLIPGDKIQVDFLRDGNKKSVSGKIMSYAETKKCKDCNCGEKSDFIFINPDIKIKIPNRPSFKESSDTEPRIDLSAMNVGMENVSNDDARSLESKGVDMKVSNDLRVENLELSPNSNVGMFELQFDLKTEGETAVMVFNPAGRTIYEYELGRFMGDFSDYIDISQNGPGTYFLQISQNGKSFVRKIVLKNN